jgi:chromosome partitioning protein
MTTFVIANQKGGVGKTTTAISLAGIAAESGGRQLLVDLDPHGSLTSYLRCEAGVAERGSYALLAAVAEGRAPESRTGVVQTAVPELDLMPAHPALATLERRFGAQPGMGRLLARVLEVLRDDYEHIWIDCPPVLGLLMINALAVCDTLIIPVQTEFLALKGLERMLSSLSMVERSRGRPMPHLIVPTLFDQRTRASIDSLDALHCHYRARLAEEPIPVDTLFRSASEAGVPLSRLRPTARGVGPYRSLYAQLQHWETPASPSHCDPRGLPA